MGIKKQRRYSKKKAGNMALDLFSAVLPGVFGAVIGYAAAKTGRGAMIGGLIGASTPLAYRGFLAKDPSRKMFLLAASTGMSLGSFYLSYATSPCTVVALPEGALPAPQPTQEMT